MKQFCALELNKVVQRIHRDCEAFYGNVYQEMVTWYERKTEELQTFIKQDLQCQKIEIEKFANIQQKLQIEYDKLEGTLNCEKEVFVQLNAVYSK
jgi:hypothetical protein